MTILTFYFAVPTIHDSPANISVPRNAEATFSCVVAAEVSSQVAISWSGPGSSLPQPVNSVENGIVTSNLTINVTDGSHEGQLYNCSAYYINCSGIAFSDSATFSIIPPPTITQAPVGGDYNINDTLALTCSAMDIGALEIIWTGPISDVQGNNLLVGDGVISNSYNTTLSNYSLGGTYTCIATNEAGSDMASVVVFIRPVVVPEVVFASNGDDITLMCRTQMSPNSSISWEKQNTLGMFEALSQAGQTLVFRSITFGDEGIYRCVASVDMQSDKISTTVSYIASK